MSSSKTKSNHNPKKEFKRIFNLLNPAQKKAVETINGPVMVVAGPGTGKTQVLTARIAYILDKTDTDPSAILALTFTESAAKNMRQRLVQMIGKTGYYVHISTFHAFCSQVIRDNPEFFPIERDSQPLSDLERYDLFEQIIDQATLQRLRPLNAVYYYLPDIVKAISNLKREGVTPDEFEQMIQAGRDSFEQEQSNMTKTEKRKQQKDLEKQQDLLEIYRAYQQQLKLKQRYDFDDMIALVVEAFEQNEMLLRDYQERLHYFLVDEYQDTNTAQNQVVDLLASYWGDKANVFVVGDPNQAIYRFQGASVENILGFIDRYPQATVIHLDQGYRCTQQLYSHASQLIQNNQLLSTDSSSDQPDQEKLSAKAAASSTKADQIADQKNSFYQDPKQELFQLINETLDSNSGQGEPIKIFQAPVQTLETVYIAQQIQELTKAGVNPEEIAVLYRYNSDETEIAAALDKWGIRYQVDGGNDVLQSEIINQLLAFFQVLLDLRRGAETETLFAIMQYPWFRLEKLAVMKLGRIAGREQCSLLDILDLGYDYLVDHDYDQLLSEAEFKAVAEFKNQLYTWSQLDLTTTFTHWFELMLQETGFMSWLRDQPQKLEILTEVNSLYNQVKSLVDQNHQLKLADFLHTIDVMNQHQLKIKAEDLNITQNAVHLSTVHKAKGQEWDYVFVIHCVDKKWGNRKPRELIPLPEDILKKTDVSKKELNEDERRVFYVAITRARKQVVITYPETVIQDNQSRDTFASQFLTEIGQVTQAESQELLDQADQYLQRLLEPEPVRTVAADEEQFFKKLISNFKLSVTALNTYLRDPQDFVENTLLRIPRAKPIPMVFGTAVHTALEKMFSVYQEKGVKPDQDYLLTEFETALKKEVLTKDEFKKRLAYGQEMLANYYQQTSDEEPDVMLVERFFGSGWSRTILDQDIYLTGRIDRVDWIDRDKKLVRVIDYKTGRNKTKGFIEGSIKSAGLSEREQQLPDSIKGPYKRQLLFYKLLTQLDRTFSPEVVEGVFDFVEPYDKATGRLMPRQFKLKQEDVDDLKQLIRQVMQEIRSLEFLKQI